jgi:sugar-specific transcriptional regulator TrmB
MNELEQSLTKLGLTGTEARVYLTGLHYRNISVGELAKQTLIKRPTLYHALATLAGKGLASKYGTKMRMRFTMTPPTQLKDIFTEQKKQLLEQERVATSLIPLLTPQGLTSKEDQLELSHFEGVTGIKTAVNMALYCRSKRWDVIAPAKNFFSEFDKEYSSYYLKTRKERGVISRSLWEDDFLKRKQKIGPEEMKERNPRILPAVMHGRFKDVIIIFDNKVLIIPSVKKLSAILLASQEIHDTFAALFEGLWQSSKPYRK